MTERLSIRWAKTCIGVTAAGALQGGEDRAEMGDDDDVGAGARAAGRARPRCGWSGRSSFRRPGGRTSPGLSQIGADDGRGLRPRPRRGAHLPVAEVDFAQGGVVRAGGGGGCSASAVATARVRSEEMTGAPAGRWADSRASAAVSERSAGRSVQPTMRLRMGGAVADQPEAGHLGPRAARPLQATHAAGRPSRQTATRRRRLGGKALVQPALGIAKARGPARFRERCTSRPRSRPRPPGRGRRQGRSIRAAASAARSWSASR